MTEEQLSDIAPNITDYVEQRLNEEFRFTEPDQSKQRLPFVSAFQKGLVTSERFRITDKEVIVNGNKMDGVRSVSVDFTSYPPVVTIEFLAIKPKVSEAL